MLIGYARVSTSGQDTASQVAELEAAGCDKVFVETASAAAGRRRPQLAKLMAGIEAGDVLAVTRLDRLGRSSRDVLNVIAAVAERQAAFKSLREAWADTTTAHGRLMVTILSGLAEFDREMILARTSEGQAQARARGVRMGRPPSLDGQQKTFVARQRADGMTIGQLAKLLGVSRSTINRVKPAADRRQIDIEELTQET